MSHSILRIDASARREGSVSRDLTDQVIARFNGATVTTRDLAAGMPLIDEVWVGANFTPADARSDDQRQALALSDTLIAELNAADTIVIGLPIYNFGVPAALKAWVDLVARAGVTFTYTEAGPKGALEGKRAILVMASGGVPAGSPVDYATTYMKHVLGFLGITDVEIVAAEALAVDAEAALKAANNAISALAA